MVTMASRLLTLASFAAGLFFSSALEAQAAGKEEEKAPESPVRYPPALPGGNAVVTDTSELFLEAPATLGGDFTIARTAPTIDFSYIPGQDYAGTPWSCWGDGLAVNGKYYTSLGDHFALGNETDPRRTGNSFVYEYDPGARTYRLLVDVQQLIKVPEGYYTPGKIHSRIDQGDDGWLYFSTHRGSVSATRVPAPRFQGDYIVRAHPGTGKAEVVCCGPIPRQCIPNGILDSRRLIFYGGTADPDSYDGPVQFFAYDVKAGKVLYRGPNGPARCMILTRSGKVYFVPGAGTGPLMRYDPEKPSEPPVALPVSVDIRATTLETPQGIVYAISRAGPATLYGFDTRSEKMEDLGKAAVGSQQYVATLDADPSGRFLYYSAGAHGGGEQDGTPVVQFDVKTRKKKVIAFLHPFYRDRYGITITGTFGSAVDPGGERLYFTWNGSRSGGKAWDCVSVAVIHVPASERVVERNE
jgi:hypothetical protein